MKNDDSNCDYLFGCSESLGDCSESLGDCSESLGDCSESLGDCSESLGDGTAPLDRGTEWRLGAVRCIYRRALYFAVMIAAVFCGLIVTPASADEKTPYEQARISAIAKAIPATVGVFGPGGQGGGSGVVISADGYALTNYHVVESNGAFMKCSMPDGVLYDAVIVGVDPTGDVALIKLLGRDDFPAATMANSDQLRAGDECFAVGNPFLLATDFQPTVSWGIVSGVHRYQYPAGTLLEYADCIQTDAAINPGNSGGALFNSNGDLIGINGRGSFEKRGRVNVGVGYAISINQIKHFLNHLKSGRIVDHATLGATVSTDVDGKVRVANLLEFSDANRKGLRIDDEILSFAGRDIQTVNQFKNVLGIYPKGWRLPISFRREGIDIEAVIRLTGVHATEELIEIVQGTVEPDSQKDDDAEEDDTEENPDVDPILDDGIDSTAIPAQYQNLHISRRGFANYYFNNLNRDRVWNKFLKHGDFTKQTFNWRLTGRLNDKSIVIVLADEKSGMQIAGDLGATGETYVLDPDQDLATQLFPQNSGGILVTLHLWRKLLVSGPRRFGNVIYFGTVPDVHRGILSEAFVATTEGIECIFMFDPSDHLLLGVEMYPEYESDPCIVRFAEFKIDDAAGTGQRLTVPSEIGITGVGLSESILEIDQIEFLENKE